MDDETIEKVNSALSEVLGADGSLINRWVVIVDVLQPDMSRACAYLSSQDMMSWEVIGMVEAASEYARLQLSMHEVVEYLEDEEDEDE